MKLSADVSLPKPDGSKVSLHYIASWAGPDKWRVEWPENGLNQITVLNNNKLSYSSGQPNPLVPLVQFESAVAALVGGDPAGPFMLPPIDFEKVKFDTSKKKVAGIDAKCFSFGDPEQTFCIDPSTYHLLSVATTVHSVELGSFEYSDYVTNGNVQFPQTIKVTYTGKTIVEAKMSISRGDKFADTIFAAPEKATSYEWPSCADVDKNFTAPHVTKTTSPKMSDAARKANKYGLVWVIATVGKDGSVTKATVIGGDPDLNTSATDAVQQYKFSPYMRCGQATEFLKVVIVPFLPPQQSKDVSVTK